MQGLRRRCLPGKTRFLEELRLPLLFALGILSVVPKRPQFVGQELPPNNDGDRYPLRGDGV